MVCDGCHSYFSFWFIFCPFTLPPSPSFTARKIKFQKNEKNAYRYHHFIRVYQKWMEGWMEKVTQRGGWPT